MDEISLSRSHVLGDSLQFIQLSWRYYSTRTTGSDFTQFSNASRYCRPPFPLIGFRAHHNPMFPSLPLGFSAHRPFPPPLPSAATGDLVNKSGLAMLPPPPASRPTGGSASLFSVLSSSAAVSPVSGLVTSGVKMTTASIAQYPGHQADTDTADMTLKNDNEDDKDTSEETGLTQTTQQGRMIMKWFLDQNISAAVVTKSDTSSEAGHDDLVTGGVEDAPSSSSGASSETVYETAARLLFMSVRWTKNLASFSALPSHDQVSPGFWSLDINNFTVRLCCWRRVGQSCFFFVLFSGVNLFTLLQYSLLLSSRILLPLLLLLSKILTLWWICSKNFKLILLNLLV